MVDSARRRHREARERARAALRRFEADGRPVTYAAVAADAQVSRAWLYTQPDLRTGIEQLRQVAGTLTRTPIPTRQRATEASLLQRLETAHLRNQRLVEENTVLRQQLAVAHADLRDARQATSSTIAAPSELRQH